MATSAKSAEKPAKTITKPATATKTKTAKAAAAPAAAKPVKQAAAPKAAAPKAAAPKAPAVKKAPAANIAKPAAAKTPAAPGLTPERRRYYVEVSAYYLAERRGFHGGSQLEDWVQAEAEIDRLLLEGILKP